MRKGAKKCGHLFLFRIKFLPANRSTPDGLAGSDPGQSVKGLTRIARDWPETRERGPIPKSPLLFRCKVPPSSLVSSFLLLFLSSPVPALSPPPALPLRFPIFLLRSTSAVYKPWRGPTILNTRLLSYYYYIILPGSDYLYGVASTGYVQTAADGFITDE